MEKNENLFLLKEKGIKNFFSLSLYKSEKDW